MIRTYVFRVYFVDTEGCFTFSFKIASSSLKSAFSKLKTKVISEFGSKCVTANVHPVYKVECNGLFVSRSIPARYPSLLI